MHPCFGPGAPEEEELAWPEDERRSTEQEVREEAGNDRQCSQAERAAENIGMLSRVVTISYVLFQRLFSI